MYQFDIRCGNWIYPARGTSTRTEYPIDFPLVVEIFVPSSLIGATVSDDRLIGKHLTGPRFLSVIIKDDKTIHVTEMKNEEEELFRQPIGMDIWFNPEALARPEQLWFAGKYPGKIEPNHQVREGDWEAVFFTSVLLHAHVHGTKLPDGIKFRQAKMAEVESLGRWQR